MKLVSVTAARDEADIIETFVRYYLQFCDHVIVCDNLSSDGTREILDALAEEDSRVHVLEDRRSGCFQTELRNRMLEEATRVFEADWVLSMDADEFLAGDGGGDVRKVIEALPTTAPVAVPWRTYVPRPDDAEAGGLLERVFHRRVREGKAYRKVLVPRELAVQPHLHLGAGSHKLLDHSGAKAKRVRTADPSTLYIGHFPIRVDAQVVKKAVNGWVGRLAVPEDERDLGRQCHPLFERVKTGVPMSSVELRDLAYAYPLIDDVCAPAGSLVADLIETHGGPIELKYEDMMSSNPVRTLATIAEALALDLSAALTLAADKHTEELHAGEGGVRYEARQQRSGMGGLADRFVKAISK